MNKDDSDFIGETSNGTEINVPKKLDPLSAMLWLSLLNVQDQADLFCMSELINLNFERQKTENELYRTMLIILNILDKRRERNIFLDIFTDLKLVTSLDRIRYAKDLITAAYL